ncbi:MAG: hypothetical protein RQ723_02485 [Desulfuromonadales bacterium]|nr:hypothetical protein [Desulfuromonadales bacterium]
MNVKLSRQMTLLGLGVLAFYAAMLATGQVSLEVLPQFAISAVIFLSSGRIMRQMAAKLPAKEGSEDEPAPEPNWELRTLVLNWVAAGAVVGIVGLFIVKPASMSFPELFEFLLHTDFAPEVTLPVAP